MVYALPETSSPARKVRPAGLFRLFLLLTILAVFSGCREAAPPADSQNTTREEESVPTGSDGEEAPETGADTKSESPETDSTPANPLSAYIKRLKVDQFNPRMENPVFANQKPRRGGLIRVRTPSEFGTLNPILATGANDRDVINYLFDSLFKKNQETLEFRPRMAWSWEDQDLVRLKGGGQRIGIIVDNDGERIRFVEGATRRTFLKADLASIQQGEPSVVQLKDTWGGAEFAGTLTEFDYTLQIDTSTQPGAKVDGIPLDDLATYEAVIGSDTQIRPAAKPHCLFRFHLRPGLQWSDGVPVSAEDWVFTMEVIRNPHIKDAAHLRNYYDDLESVQSLDGGRALEFLWKKPYFLALEFSGGEDLVPLPRHVFQPEQFAGDPAAFADAFVKNEFSQKPVGCGPYKFEDWRADRLSIVRNPNYYAPQAGLPYYPPERPYLDGIIWLVINNSTVALKEIQKGAVDLDPEVEPTTWVSAEANSDAFTRSLVRAHHTGLLYTYIGWNLERPWFKDKRVRTALALLVPAERIARDIHFGLAQRVSQPFYINGPIYDHSLEPLPYDPARARRLLREAGWLDRNGDGILENDVEVTEDGKTVRRTLNFEFEYSIHTAKDYHQKIANIVKEEFGKVGIKVNVRPMEFASFIQGILDQNFDACRLAWGTNMDGDPFQVWHSSQAVKGGSNHVNFRNAECDTIMEKAREVFDPIERWNLYRRMSRIIFEEQPMCFLFAFELCYFYQNKFRGVKLYPHQYPVDLTEWWIADTGTGVAPAAPAGASEGR